MQVIPRLSAVPGVLFVLMVIVPFPLSPFFKNAKAFPVFTGVKDVFAPSALSPFSIIGSRLAFRMRLLSYRKGLLRNIKLCNCFNCIIHLFDLDVKYGHFGRCMIGSMHGEDRCACK
jgi:hypothetical protein